MHRDPPESNAAHASATPVLPVGALAVGRETLESIMTLHVVSVSMDDTLRNVREIFNCYKIHHVVVTDCHRLVGIVSDRDLLANLSPYAEKPLERSLDAASLNRKVHQIMTRKVVVARPETTVAEAANLLLEYSISSLPVVNAGGTCLGIVTWRDVLRCTFKEPLDMRAAPPPRQQAA